MEGSVKAQGRFRESSGKVQERFREGSGKVQGRFREGSVKGKQTVIYINIQKIKFLSYKSHQQGLR